MPEVAERAGKVQQLDLAHTGVGTIDAELKRMKGAANVPRDGNRIKALKSPGRELLTQAASPPPVSGWSRATHAMRVTTFR